MIGRSDQNLEFHGDVECSALKRRIWEVLHEAFDWNESSFWQTSRLDAEDHSVVDSRSTCV
jgi:hypothetical protein